MNLRSLMYTGAVVATAAVVPVAAFAQGAPTPGSNPFAYSQRSNNTIQARAGFSGGTSDLATIVGNIINIVLGFLGILLLVYLVYAGFLWMTAGGSEDNTKKARQMIQNAVIGLIIIVSSFAISSFVLNSLPTITGGSGASATR